MKVLLLGTGRNTPITYSTCHACPSEEEYTYCVTKAKLVVTLDIDSNTRPDVIANIQSHQWSVKVSDRYGKDFDVIIDATGTVNDNDMDNILVGVCDLLADDGVFYSYLNGEKHSWFKKGSKLYVSESSS